MATVTHVTSGSGLRKFQADGFLFNSIRSLLKTIFVSYLVSYARETTCRKVPVLCTNSIQNITTPIGYICCSELHTITDVVM